jgi:hypothetical protein
MDEKAIFTKQSTDLVKLYQNDSNVALKFKSVRYRDTLRPGRALVKLFEFLERDWEASHLKLYVTATVVQSW